MFKKVFIIFFTVLLSLSSCVIVFAEDTASVHTKKATPSGIAIPELEAYVDDYVEDYIGKTLAGTSIVILKDGQAVLSKGYGFADVEQQHPVTQKTVFEWGSISKLVVWTSVMQLAEQGKLDLQADIRTYLPPGFLTKLKFDEPVTMMNLMNHNAGFEEYMFDMAYSSPEKVRSLEEGLLLAQPAQVHKPGEVVAYSNFSNSLAAYIVEKISGQKYYDYVAEHIFAKLGMNETTANPTLADRPDLVAVKSMGYELKEEGTFNRSSWNYMSMYPNGGINGTAEDLAKFAGAFIPAAGEQSPLFARQDTLGEMLTQSYAVTEDMPGIAHGFWEYPGVHKALGHGGNTIAFSSNLQIVPEDHFAVVIMTNQSGESNIVHGLAKAMLGQQEIEAVKEGLPDNANLKGSYIAARRPYYGFMKVYPYLTLLKVKPDGSNHLQISLAGMNAGYVQIKPYLYEKISGDTSLDAWPRIYFKVSGDKVDKITVYTTEYLPLPVSKSIPVLTVNAILAVLSVLYFIISPLILCLQAVLNKRKKRTRPVQQAVLHKFAVWMTLTGTGLVVNNLVLALRMLSNYERAYSEVFPHIILNYILTGLGILIAAALLLYWNKKKPALQFRQKCYYIISILMLVVLIALLVVWQFYQ